MKNLIYILVGLSLFIGGMEFIEEQVLACIVWFTGSFLIIKGILGDS